MIDRYIILHRKPRVLMKVFIFNIFLLTGLVIWGINTFMYQNYFQVHSQVLNLNSYYFLEVLIPVKEVNTVTYQNKLWINKKEYHYRVIDQGNNITYLDGDNYLTLYLAVDDLEKMYQINGYHIDIRIAKKKETIFQILKNKEEI